MSEVSKGDVVSVLARALGQLMLVYPWLSSTDTLLVTRVDRATGRKALYCRKVGAEHHVAVIWPDSVKVVRRAPAPRRSRA